MIMVQEQYSQAVADTGGRGCSPLFRPPPVAPLKWGGRGAAALPLKSSTDGGRLPPFLMQQSPSENEKTFSFWGLRPQTPTGTLPLDPELNFAK